jgi:hypothetical protein
VFQQPSSRQRIRAVGAAAAALAALSGLALVPTASAGAAGTPPLFAYAQGGAQSPAMCPRTAAVPKQCTLGQALALVQAGGSVLLATPATTAPYVGDHVVTTPGTDPAHPVTLAPAPGVTGVTLDGDLNAGLPCPTPSCQGAILSLGGGEDVTLDALTFTDANNTTPRGQGGGVDVAAGAHLIVSDSTFDHVGAPLGGGIDVHGPGSSAVVSDSAFTSDGANAGGAIAVRFGSVAVSGSTFSGDTAGDGGAIAVGPGGSNGSLSVTGSTFSGGGAVTGGDLSVGDHGGQGTALVQDSGFWNSGASDGAAIDLGDWGGSGSLQLEGVSVGGNGAGDGGGVDVADHQGTGRLTVQDSTLSGNAASDGGNLDVGDHGGTGTLDLEHATVVFGSGNDGGGIDAGDHGGQGATTAVSSTLDGNGGDAGLNDVSGSTVLAGTVVAGSGQDCLAPVTDAGFNLEDDAGASCGFGAPAHSLSGADPKLGPLAANGGSTETMAPAPDSPAVDLIPDPTTVTLPSGPDTLCPGPDQRGVGAPALRLGCAAGAVDLGDPARPLVQSVSPAAGPAAGGTRVTITGSGLSGATAVAVGATDLLEVTVTSDRRITGVLPAQPAGTEQVTVTTAEGTSPWRPGADVTFTP